MHSGQVRCCRSQGSTHSLWNSWAQEMILNSCQRDRENVIFNVLLVCLNTKVVLFLSGFDGLSRPSSKSYNAFLFFPTPTWPSMNSSRQMAQIGLELELLFDPGTPRECWDPEQPWELYVRVSNLLMARMVCWCTESWELRKYYYEISRVNLKVKTKSYDHADQERSTMMQWKSYNQD